MTEYTFAPVLIFFPRCSNPVIALCVPNDVYLSYSTLILTSVFRIASFPLNLRTTLSHAVAPSSSEPPLPGITEPPTSTGLTASTTCVPSDLLTPMDGPPAYVSLLGAEPFTPPAILTRCISLPRLSSGTPAREFMLTPDSLRFLGTQVASITAHIRAVLLAHRSVEDRVELQKTEFARMQDKCGVMLRLVGLLNERVKAIQGAKEEGIVGRVERMKGTHKELMGRADRMLQVLMNGASPELSECEAKWFGELGRMKAEVIGAGRFDEGSLKARSALVSDDACLARFDADCLGSAKARVRTHHAELEGCRGERRAKKEASVR
jgi:nucleoporin NUP82